MKCLRTTRKNHDQKYGQSWQLCPSYLHQQQGDTFRSHHCDYDNFGSAIGNERSWACKSDGWVKHRLVCESVCKSVCSPFCVFRVSLLFCKSLLSVSQFVKSLPEMCTKCSPLRGPLPLPTYTQAMSSCRNSESPVRTCELVQSAEEKQLWKRSIEQCESSSRVQKMSSLIEDIDTFLVASSVRFEDVARVWTLNRPKKNRDKKASEPHL